MHTNIILSKYIWFNYLKFPWYSNVIMLYKISNNSCINNVIECELYTAASASCNS